MLSPSQAAELAELGPFFEVAGHPVGDTAPAPWRAMGELVDDPAVLPARVAAVRERLASGARRPVDTVAPRVAASVTQLGLVARLVSPVLGAAALHGRLLGAGLPQLWWRPELGGAFPLSVPVRIGVPSERPGDGDLAAQLADWLSAGPVADLVAATGRMSVSPQVLWGNVASAVRGAVHVLLTARPDRAGPVTALWTALQSQAPLRGSGTESPEGRFRRRSCCLIYRAAASGSAAFCGDCVLTR